MFKFELGKAVIIGPQKRKAVITSRCEYIHGGKSYTVQTVADGDKPSVTVTDISEAWVFDDPEGTSIPYPAPKTDEQEI